MYVLCEEEYKRFIALDKLVEKQAPITPPKSYTYNDNMEPTSESLASGGQPASSAAPVSMPVSPKVVRSFECKVCGKLYSSKRELQRHIKKLHAPPTHVDVIPKAALIVNPPEINEPKLKIKNRKPHQRGRKDPFTFKVSKWLTLN